MVTKENCDQRDIQHATEQEQQECMADWSHHLETAHLLCVSICICTIWKQTGVITMNHIVNTVLRKEVLQKFWG